MTDPVAAVLDALAAGPDDAYVWPACRVLASALVAGHRAFLAEFAAALPGRLAGLRPDWSVAGRPEHLIRYEGKSVGCLKRIARNERAKQMARQKQLAELARHEQAERWQDDEEGTW